MRVQDDPQLEVRVGAATPAEARVFVRSHGAPAGGVGLRSGYVQGPYCDYARTLPARIPLAEAAVGKGPSSSASRGAAQLLTAVVPDPCFWTPALPMRYEAVVQLAGSVDFSPRDAGEPAHQGKSHVLPFGIRPLYRRGRRLVLDGQVWALRAVAARSAPDAALADWRAAGAALLVANPDNQLCGDADRQGVLLVADLSALAADEALAALRRLAGHPSAGFLVLPAGERFSEDARSLAAGGLLCQRIDPRLTAAPADDRAGLAAPLEAWADVALVDAVDPAAAAAYSAACPLPAIACRHPVTATDVAAARRECDVLQADLAGRADFAGYVV